MLSNLFWGLRLVVLSLSDSAESIEGQVKHDSSSGVSAKLKGTQGVRRDLECMTASAKEMTEDQIPKFDPKWHSGQNGHFGSKAERSFFFVTGTEARSR